MVKRIVHILLIPCMAILPGCEKEIAVDIPLSKERLVVEASINQYSPILNYVFITKSVDYFNPDLSMGGLEGAVVTITEGTLSGTDTIYEGTKTYFLNIKSIPGADSLFSPYDSVVRLLTGIYFKPDFMGKENTPYKLNVTLADGRKVEGKTFIPTVIPIDTIKYEIVGSPDDSGRYNNYASVYWFDPPGQNNYRMASKKGLYGNILIGWGAADNFSTFDDEMQDNQKRFMSFHNPFRTNDTLSVYFNTIGRKEFLFWQSFSQATNNNPLSSAPVALKSNVSGAIGTFTGYAVSYKQVIFKKP